MGTVECCQNQKNPDFVSPKSENKHPKNIVLKEVPLQQGVIKHDRIQVKKQPSFNDNFKSLQKQTPQKQKWNQKSEVQLYNLKSIESRRQDQNLETNPETKHEKQHLTQSKVKQYQMYEKESKQSKQHHQIPVLNHRVKSTLEKNQFFRNQFNFQPKVIAFTSQVYEGQTEIVNNIEIPSGYGKMYKSDGSLYIGEFQKGKAEGKGAYIFTDGSYYQGNFKDNQANDQYGIFKGFNFEYRGGFKKNTFHGKGSEKAEDHYFEGTYNNGEKVNGTLTWEDENYIYKGPFENQKFHGKGHLIEPTGEYQGYFNYGVKHGAGEYRFSNSLKYVGEYKNNKREGKGILYNPGSSVPAYQGDFQDGLPHGDGFIVDENGNRVSTKWIMGIDSLSL